MDVWKFCGIGISVWSYECYGIGVYKAAGRGMDSGFSIAEMTAKSISNSICR